MSAQPTAHAGTAPVQATHPDQTAAFTSVGKGPIPEERLAEVIELYPVPQDDFDLLDFDPGVEAGFPGGAAQGRSKSTRRRSNRLAILRLKLKYFGRARLMASEAGMATAEYAIATLAAVGFAGVLVFLLRSEEVRGFLLNLIRTALALP